GAGFLGHAQAVAIVHVAVGTAGHAAGQREAVLRVEGVGEPAAVLGHINIETEMRSCCDVRKVKNRTLAGHEMMRHPSNSPQCSISVPPAQKSRTGSSRNADRLQEVSAQSRRNWPSS